MRYETLDLLRTSLSRFGSDGAADFYEAFADTPARRQCDGKSSRQARHARAQRQRSLALAGAIALVYEEPHWLAAFLTPELAALRVYSAQTHTRMVHLAETTGAYAGPNVEIVWERLVAKYIELGRNAHRLDRNHLLVLHSIQAALSPALHLVDRGRARACWRQLSDEARRYGLLANPSCRLWLALSGSHVGEPGAHVDWLLDPRLHAFDLADTLCFVRRDLSEELLDATAAIVRGSTLRADHWHPVAMDQPVSTWLRLADYVRACSRMSRHCQNEGQLLMVLSWVGDLHCRLAQLERASRRQLQPGTLRLFQGLRQIEAVQILEKNRFLDVLSGASSPVRNELEALWRLSASLAPALAEASAAG